MSNLTSKITDTYFPKDEQHFFKLFLRFLLVTFGGAAFIQIAGSFSLFYFGEFTDLVCAILYATAIVFQLITLPVEFNASRRATDILAAEGYLDYGEVQGAQKVLRAAALTYIASFLLSLLQFLRLLAITGSRRD